MGRSNDSNTWFMRLFLFAALMMIFGLPAIYWAGTKFLGVDLKKSVEGTFRRMFSHAPSFGNVGGDGASDDGGD